MHFIMTLLPNRYFIPDDFFEKKEHVTGPFSLPTQQDMKRTQKELANNLCSTVIKKDNIPTIPNYDEFLQPSNNSKPKEFSVLRPSDPELDEALQDLEYIAYNKKGEKTDKDYHEILKITDYILERYAASLSRKEYIHIILTKALAYNQLKDYIQVEKQLRCIEPYIQYFDTDQFVAFYDFMGNAFLEAGDATDNLIFFQKSLDAFKKLIDNANERSQLDPDVYQRTQYKIGKILMFTQRDSEAIKIFEEIIDMPDALFDDDDLATRTNKGLKRNSYYNLWIIFEDQKKYKQAIAAYFKYLDYNPRDEDIKKKIRLLSEQASE